MNKNSLYTENLETINILFVEDDLEVQKQTKKLLGNFFENITCANNGMEGLELYKKEDKLNKYNLIITDIQMSSYSGLEMIRSIREINKEVRIIIISAHDKTEYFIDAIKFGINGYLLKPFSRDKIIEVLVDNVNYILDKEHCIRINENYCWNNNTKNLQYNNELVKLTNNEKNLLTLFVNEPNKTMSSDEIEYLIFDDFNSNNKKVRNLISRFNSKLTAPLIESIYALGYRIKYN